MMIAGKCLKGPEISKVLPIWYTRRPSHVKGHKNMISESNGSTAHVSAIRHLLPLREYSIVYCLCAHARAESADGLAHISEIDI